MGNQPSLIVPWLGHWFGDPALTTDALARTRAELFRNAPDGLPGNDDTGGLSAWYVLSALGLGPVQPGTDLLSLSPRWRRRSGPLAGGTGASAASAMADRRRPFRWASSMTASPSTGRGSGSGTSPPVPC